MGAWIETNQISRTQVRLAVAPRVGAWIETHAAAVLSRAETSHPVWVRGLKQKFCVMSELSDRSHPVWVRGLKLLFLRFCLRLLKSHPVWVRGLKRFDFYNLNYLIEVAPRVGAWIETRSTEITFKALSSRTPCGCVD